MDIIGNCVGNQFDRVSVSRNFISEYHRSPYTVTALVAHPPVTSGGWEAIISAQNSAQVSVDPAHAG
jgi:hypothetical protein